MPKPPEQLPLSQAIQVFIQRYGYPYLSERINDLWVLRDAPRKKHQN